MYLSLNRLAIILCIMYFGNDLHFYYFGKNNMFDNFFKYIITADDLSVAQTI